MEQTDKGAAEKTESTLGRMPLNAGVTGYGSVSVPGLSGSVGASESAPLLIPEPEPVHRWKPLSKEELEAAAGGPGWRKVRRYLVLLFWLAWVAMLATSIAIVVMSPRPTVTPLKWWQKTVFYQLRPDLSKENQTEGSEGIDAAEELSNYTKRGIRTVRLPLCEQLPYLRSLGIGALILEGLSEKAASPFNLNGTDERFRTLAQIQHLLVESSKTGLKVVLDFCGLDVAGNTDGSSNLSATFHALQFWLEKGVAGFAICDTDTAYSEKTLLEWRAVSKEFSSPGEERIVVVKQTRDVLSPLNNVTLVDVVMRSILPPSHHLLSASEVADAIQTHLQPREEDIWTSWTVGGKTSRDLKKLLLVLLMTLPGSPAVKYGEYIEQTQNMSLRVDSSQREMSISDAPSDKERTTHSAVALFTSLSRSRASEEALLYGSLTFLPFNSSTNASSNSTHASPSPPPVLAFLRSWGCVHFLILLNVGPELHVLDPAWASSLPEAGVFVSSTGMDRLGSMTLDQMKLRPHEAVVIKLFKGGSYS